MENQETHQKFGNGTRVSLSREILMLHNITRTLLIYLTSCEITEERICFLEQVQNHKMFFVLFYGLFCVCLIIFLICYCICNCIHQLRAEHIAAGSELNKSNTLPALAYIYFTPKYGALYVLLACVSTLHNFYLTYMG